MYTNSDSKTEKIQKFKKLREWLFANKSPHVVQLKLKLNAHKLKENLEVPKSKEIKKNFHHRLRRISKA
jgi:hypothetical protein